MEPIEFIHRVEAMSIKLFESYLHARMATVYEQKALIPQQHYYAYIYEHRLDIQSYNDETVNHCIGRLADVHKALLLTNIATGAVAGAILQIARQCISLAWPTTKERMNKGRMVGSQHLSSVIWHARNQALHFEEGIPKNENTRKSIELLSDEFSIPIDNLNKSPRPLSVEILEILEWNNYEAYAKDIVGMLNQLK